MYFGADLFNPLKAKKKYIYNLFQKCIGSQKRYTRVGKSVVVLSGAC